MSQKVVLSPTKIAANDQKTHKRTQQRTNLDCADCSTNFVFNRLEHIRTTATKITNTA